MIFLNEFKIIDDIDDELFINDQILTCYDSYYPYNIFRGRGLSKVYFDDITILYGGNGSGKTTLLNIIADKIKADRIAPYNKTEFFCDYVNGCSYDMLISPYVKKFIASDDVFDYMLDIRNLNEGIDDNRKIRLEQYSDYKHNSTNFRFEGLHQLDELRLRNKARSRTKSRYIRETSPNNIRELSNGETALRYFYDHINRDGIYLLDEPENSMSPKRQRELVQFIEDSARFYNCQFIIATHSPFVLSLKGATVYNLDQTPIDTANWRTLENIREYYAFFKEHEEEIEKLL